MNDDLRFERKFSDSRRAHETRSPGGRDRDRILYSSAFRRLSGITQVISPTGHHPTHNRLTHSLEVTQIGRSIALSLLHPDHGEVNQDLIDNGGGIHPDVVEAACLAHDLGHPPFGHLAETTLNTLAIECGLEDSGYEGNAQSFRIVTSLSAKNPGYYGLNLTRATLSAMSKYPWGYEKNPLKTSKWGFYPYEEEVFEFSREHLPTHLQRLDPTAPNRDIRTLEAQIMDWADDVAYAIHDLEDFVRIGLIPIDRLRDNRAELNPFLQKYFERESVSLSDEETHRSRAVYLLTLFPLERSYSANHDNRSALRQYTSNLVTRYIAGIRLGMNAHGDASLLIQEEHAIEINLLKNLIWFYIIEGRSLASQRFGQENLITYIFNTLRYTADDRLSQRYRDLILLLPEYYADTIIEGNSTDEAITRTIIDFIAGLTEPQVVDLYRRLTGNALGSALDPIIY